MIEVPTYDVGGIVTEQNVVEAAAVEVLDRDIDVASGVPRVRRRQQKVGAETRLTGVVADFVCACSAIEDVGASFADQDIVASAAGETVGYARSIEDIVNWLPSRFSMEM